LNTFGGVASDGVIGHPVAAGFPKVNAVISVAGNRIVGDRVSVAALSEIYAVYGIVREGITGDGVCA
jgi:hypothetical protein